MISVQIKTGIGLIIAVATGDDYVYIEYEDDMFPSQRISISKVEGRPIVEFSDFAIEYLVLSWLKDVHPDLIILGSYAKTVENE